MSKQQDDEQEDLVNDKIEVALLLRKWFVSVSVSSLLLDDSIEEEAVQETVC